MAEPLADHTVSVSAHFERERDDFLLKAPTTYAVLEVRPPIKPWDEFKIKRIVLGREWSLVDMTGLFENVKAAVFMAESSHPDKARRHEDIAEIARRLGRMANNPGDVLAMMEERPFPEKKPDPPLRVVKDEPPEKEAPPASVPPDEKDNGGITVHLAPVEVPPLNLNVPPVPMLDRLNLKPSDLPPVVIPDPTDVSEAGQPSVFGPPSTGLTGFAPEAARILPWPPSRGGGRHARKDPKEN